MNFAGIGGFRQGIDLFAKDNAFNSICLGYSEFDKYAEQTYCANFDNTGVVSMGDIVEFNNDSKNIEKLGKFNVLTEDSLSTLQLYGKQTRTCRRKRKFIL